MSGAFRSACACFSDSQFPMRTPIDFALFTQAMPAANSGASSSLSAASAAVDSPGNRGGDAVQHQRLQPLPLGDLRNDNQISHLLSLAEYSDRFQHTDSSRTTRRAETPNS
jgi:hypothetical protein